VKKSGPDSRKTVKAMRELDRILSVLIEELERKKLDDNVNVVILSDHGMAASTKVIELEKHVDFNDVEKAVGEGTFAMVAPEKKKMDNVYQQLRQANVKGLNVYKKDKLPKRFHIRESDLVLPIVLTADEGYVINLPEIKNKVYPGEPQDQQGYNGYDPDDVDEMNTIMYAFGPDFRADFEAEPIRQVDHYNLLCHLTGVKPKPNDGVWGRVQQLLKSEEPEDSDENDSSEEDGDNAASQTTLSLLLVALVTLRMALFK